MIHAYDIQQMKELSVSDGNNQTKIDPINFHDKENGEIMDLLPIEEMQLLASAGRDKKICLWNMETLQPKSPLLGHT